MDNKLFTQHIGKVIETDKFKHIMALTLDPNSGNREGIIRCITKRSGDVQIRGYVDRSKLYKVRGETLEKFEITEPLKIQGQDEIIDSLISKELDFIGLEDPDIWPDPNTGITHVYFTIPIRNSDKEETYTYLGHAEGLNLDSLKMTEPVISKDQTFRAKEVSIAPVNKNGIRLNLVESYEIINGIYYSIVRIAEAFNPSKDWRLGGIVFHPKTQGFGWIGGHASPGPLFPKNFIDVGEGRALGILNGREANTIINGQTHYGIFSIGLMIYNYELGKIEWVSDTPLIRDSQAKTITFGSHFVPLNNNEGILYAHVDDSFVRAYTLKSEGLKKLIQKNFSFKNG
jgi:hypothetical protein